MRIESESRSNYDFCFCAEPDASGTFFIGTMGNMGWELWDGARLLSADEARQLRDELTAFLGEPKCQRCAANEHLLSELPGLRDANEALRRDNADLTAQKDRLIKENVRLREAERARDALLAKHDAIARENTALRQRAASLEKDNADLTVKWNNLVEDEARLREENARLKVDLMNARAQHADLRCDFVNLYGDRIKPILTIALSCDTQDL